MFTECHFSPNYFLYPFCFRSMKQCSTITYCQGIVKGAILCFKNLYFYFWNGKSTSTASPLTSPASQKSKDLNKVSLLLQDLDNHSVPHHQHLFIGDLYSSVIHHWYRQLKPRSCKRSKTLFKSLLFWLAVEVLSPCQK